MKIKLILLLILLIKSIYGIKIPISNEFASNTQQDLANESLNRVYGNEINQNNLLLPHQDNRYKINKEIQNIGVFDQRQNQNQNQNQQHKTENNSNQSKNNNNNNNNILNSRKLKFSNDGKFKIVQFTDIHFGEGEDKSWGVRQDINSTEVMNTILNSEPDVDLILFTGDLITGNNIKDNATIYWIEVISAAKHRGIPWAITFGNHDDLASGQGGSRNDLLEFDIELGSFSKFGPKNVSGVSNYYLEIFDQNGIDPLSLLWVFDSGDGSCNSNKRNNKFSRTTRTTSSSNSFEKCNTFITKNQVDWYKDTLTQYQMENKESVKWSGSFFHIPLQEYMTVWNNETCYGWNNDSIACQPVNSGLFDQFKQDPTFKLVSVGHNHGNDFCGNLQGIDLCFGRHTGYGGYGTWERGARIFELNYNPSENTVTHQTWLRFETGEKVENQIKHDPNINDQQSICTN